MTESMLDLMFDFSVPWFYIALILIVFIFILWIFLAHEVRYINNDDITSTVLVLVIYLISLALYAAVFIQSVKKEPAFDFGFNLSILIGTLLFYLSFALFITFLIRSMIKIKSANQFCNNFILSIFLFSTWLLSYSLAYSSPSGVFLCILQFISCMWQTKFRCKNIEQSKQKKD